MKTDVDIRLLLVLMKEKKYFEKLSFFLFSKPNVVYLRPFLTCLQFPKLKKKSNQSNLLILEISHPLKNVEYNIAIKRNHLKFE